MVCYQDANGNATAQRNARGKHYVVFDKPEDKGHQLKAAYPNLGWAVDTEQGHAALPFSVAARLLLPIYVPAETSHERDDACTNDNSHSLRHTRDATQEPCRTTHAI